MVETDGCDWGCYSFSLNMERPYNEIPLPAINGNVLPPTGLKTDGSCSSKCAAPGFDIIQPS
ncbi:hypothetical protein [Bradyrhizobium sp. 151]|uniref:hypothetical protein n=1 Tax=Bradyrhizobium sp. 151 TaxID=2782626 RepID=UPI001FFA0688|nr:hypothetical protein [Bradyrhizobium sp. 151]MCK1656165.1 hypothetical protein [Bradyrhizobium sp. 151]